MFARLGGVFLVFFSSADKKSSFWHQAVCCVCVSVCVFPGCVGLLFLVFCVKGTVVQVFVLLPNLFVCW